MPSHFSTIGMPVNSEEEMLELAQQASENSIEIQCSVTFREDDSRIRKGQAAENFAVVRRLALSLLKQERTAKVGIAAKRFKAALYPDYLLNVLMA